MRHRNHEQTRPSRDLLGDYPRRLVLTILAAVVLILPLRAPWTVIGSAERSSFATMRTAQRLGLDHLDPYRGVLYLLPVVALGAVYLAGIKKWTLAQCLLLAVAVGELVGVYLVWSESVRLGWGAYGSTLGSVVVIATIIGRWIYRRTTRHGGLRHTGR